MTREGRKGKSLMKSRRTLIGKLPTSIMLIEQWTGGRCEYNTEGILLHETLTPIGMYLNESDDLVFLIDDGTKIRPIAAKFFRIQQY